MFKRSLQSLIKANQINKKIDLQKLIVKQNKLNFKNYSSISFLKKENKKKQDENKLDQETQHLQEVQEQNESGENKMTPEERSKIVDEQLEKLMDLEQEQQRIHEEQVQIMHAKHQELSLEMQQKVDIPFKLYGWLNMPETKTAYMAERVFAQNRIPKHKILDHLYKIFTGTLYSMIEQDKEFLYEYCEKQFADKMMKSVEQLKEQGYKFRVVEDLTGIGGEPISKFYYLSDMVMVRGLDIDRSENHSYKEYHEFKDSDDMGIVIYTPQYLSQPEAFVDPKRNKTIYEEEYQKVIMRVLVPIKTPLRIQVFQTNEEGKEEMIKMENDMYTWEHLAIFETQMVPPEKFKSFYKAENYMEWLGKFKFGTWKMVDLDNWMEGNPLIIKDSPRKQFTDPVFKGSKYDPSVHIDLRNV